VTALELSGVSVAYDGTPVLSEVDLRIGPGEWLGLVGPNGAGKTTLLRALIGFVPTSGELRVDGATASTMARRLLARTMAYVPQRPVIPEPVSVTDYVLMGRTPHISYLGTEGERDLEAVRDALERLDLTALAERPLGSLSGGEVQRAVLGRALAQQAPVLLLDEPTAALDVGHQQQVLELIDELRRERDLTVVSAMHDLSLAGQFPDRLVLLSEGRTVAEGHPRAVLTETTIREHYGASVRIIEGSDGRVLVLPTRAHRRAPNGRDEA
jgi:iron complex transport system ATP-binding protein